MKENRKKLISIIIPVLILVVLVVGATFAYFNANNIASGTTGVQTTTKKMGTVIVNNPTEDLYLRLTASDMGQNNQGNNYYFTEVSNESGSNYSLGKENNVLARYSISGGSIDTIYNCTFKLNITKPEGIQAGDMTLKLSGLDTNLNVETDLVSADTSYTVSFNRVGNGEGNLVLGDLTLNNTVNPQNYLEGQNISASVNISDLNCTIDDVEKPKLANDVDDYSRSLLQPVIYDGNDWIVVSYDDPSWYNYANQEWANAVLSKTEYNIGTKIKVDGSDSNVLGMYVWIPRFEYRFESFYGDGESSRSLPGEIDVNFISKSTTVASEGYMIHPAFNFDGNELPGIWVAKFEMSHTGGQIVKMNCTDDGCTNASGIRVLPDKQALGGNTISSMFYGIKSLDMISGGYYDLAEERHTTRMMKNSEWGAVAYLTQSKYGKYGNSDYSGLDNEVYINNSSSYYTGRSGGTYGGNVSTSTYGTYTYDGYLLDGNTKTSTRDMTKIASTTGNITGIYDMSGGAWDTMMGVFANSNGDVWSGRNNTSSNSGFTGYVGASIWYTGSAEFPDAKYYDKYQSWKDTTLNLINACNGGTCYGHAMTETDGFYGDNYGYVSSTLPWISRGGDSASAATAGIFSLGRTTGSFSANVTTRPVIVPINTISHKEETKYKNGEVVYFDVEKGTKCSNYVEENSLTGYNGIDNKTGNQNSCLKFYAFNDTKKSTINLLLDHNTTATSLWNDSGDNSTGPTELVTKLKNDTKDWKGTIEPVNYTTGITGRRFTVNYDGYNARVLTANDVAEIIGFTGWHENYPNMEKFFFDSQKSDPSSTCTEGNITDCKFGWLYDRTDVDCELEGCYNNAEVDISGYWTISMASVNSATEEHQELCSGYVNFGISHHGRMGVTCPNYPDHYGVRPVIEVMKKDLK